MISLRKILCVATLTLVSALSGCDGFFFKQASTTIGPGTGNYVYVANSGSNSVAGFQIATTGALTATTNSPYVLGVSPIAVTVSRNNAYVYLATSAGIFGYSVGTAGALTILNSGGALVASSNGSQSLETSPDGQWLISLNGDGISVSVYSIQTGGLLGLKQVVSYAGLAGTAVPKMIRIAPSGAYVFAALGTGGEVVYSFNTTTGVLAQVAVLNTPNLSSDNAIAVDSTSSYLYLVRSGVSQGLSVFTLGTSGSLTQTGSTYATGTQPSGVAIDSTNKYLYVANRGDSTISGYGIFVPAALTSLPGSPYSSGAGVSALGMDSTGKWLLASAQSSSPDLSLDGFDAVNLGRIYSVSSTATGTNAAAIGLTH